MNARVPPMERWEGESSRPAVDWIERNFASVREVLFVQPTELHLPTDVRRACEVVGPCCFRIDPKAAPIDLGDRILSVARTHPTEAWFRIDAGSRLEKHLRSAYPSILGQAEIHCDLIDDIEEVARQLEPQQLLVASLPEGNGVLVLGDTAGPDPVATEISNSDHLAVTVEVEDLHEFFADWFAGRLPETELAFSRFELALADNFELIDPNGAILDQRALTQSLRAAYGRFSADDDFSIWIENIQVRAIDSSRVIATYEEWQRRAMKVTVRTSTAVLRLRAEGTPGGVEWLHVHECWQDR